MGMNIRQLLMQGVNLGELDSPWLMLPSCGNKDHSTVSNISKIPINAADPCRLDCDLSLDDMEEPHSNHRIRIPVTPDSTELTVLLISTCLGSSIPANGSSGRREDNPPLTVPNSADFLAGCGGPEWEHGAGILQRGHLVFE